MTTKAYGAHAADKPLQVHRHRAPRARPARCADRDRLLRRLPFRPAHRALGVGWHAVSLRARPRDRRPRQRRGQRGDRLQGRRHRGRRLPGRQLPALRGLRRGPGAVLRERLRRHLQRPDAGCARAHAGRLLAAHRGRREVRAEDPPPRSAARRGRAAAVRGHHHLFAAAALEGRSRQQGRHRRHRRPGPHGREARARDGRARGGVHHLAKASARRRWIWARTRWWSRATRAR